MIDIDNVLVSVGMGRYQFTGCVLFGLMIMYSNISPNTYVFTASDLKYRCEIPGCDLDNRLYEPEWLRHSTPYRDDAMQPMKCKRYVALAGPTINGTRCTADSFNHNITEQCNDDWVFEDAENTIGREFGLMCEDNKWKLSMVGTINSVGTFIGIPVSGVIADKFGRKFTMVFCAAMSAAICIVQSFSNSYSMFLLLELLSSTVSSGIYTVTFILAMELFLPHQRVLYYSILECFLPVGGMLMALVASQVKDWRLLLRISNVPGLLFLSYFWLTEESMRWLEMQGKHDKVINALKKIASVNKKPLPDIPMSAKTEVPDPVDTNDKKSSVGILKDIIRSPTIFWRMIRCSYVWIAAILVYYGLTINAADIAGDKYLNFTLALFVEIPACLLNWLIMEGMSRRMALSSMFVLSGGTCVLYAAMPTKWSLIRLSLFMLSKLAISVAFSIVYMLTTEIFPTQMRATMVSMCSMIGRIGSILAPMTPVLTQYFGEHATILLFGATALAGGAITMTLPESKNVKLPDTVDEALQIGVADAAVAMENGTAGGHDGNKSEGVDNAAMTCTP